MAATIDVQSRLVWLAELDATCEQLRRCQSPAALELAAGLRAAAAERVRRGFPKPPTAFRFYPDGAQCDLLTQALTVARRELWGRAA